MNKYLMGTDVLGAQALGGRGQKIPLVGGKNDGQVSTGTWVVVGVAIAGMFAAGIHFMRAK